jgi:hypothetical protein
VRMVGRACALSYLGLVCWAGNGGLDPSGGDGDLWGVYVFVFGEASWCMFLGFGVCVCDCV